MSGNKSANKCCEVLPQKDLEMNLTLDLCNFDLFETILL